MTTPREIRRAAIVVTGTEVLSGTRRDRNGPWLAGRLREVGVQVAHVLIVGDRGADVLAALRFSAAEQVDLVITSGGLGPTADDLTAEVVAEVAGVPMVLDSALEGRIAAIVAPLQKRFENLDADALAAGTRKQAMVPEGATVIEPAGTAPGLVVKAQGGAGPVVVALPGPPRELQPMFEAALETEAVRGALAGIGEIRESVLRLFGIPESEIAATLRAADDRGIALAALEITTCLHNGEIEVSTTYAPEDQDAYAAFAGFVAERHAQTLFSTDGTTVDQQVAAQLVAAEMTVATAESCTGGLLAARLTETPGASRYMRGGMVTYANDSKTAIAGVSAAVIDADGAVSQAVAEALADGARARLGADVGVGITGVAGPGGGSVEKPVGLVWLSVSLALPARSGAAPDDSPETHAWDVPSAEVVRLTRSVTLPGSRADVRERATTVAMHLLRRLLLQAGVSAGARAQSRQPPAAAPR
jgi:nicotinamide-nucleotide amidase